MMVVLPGSWTLSFTFIISLFSNEIIFAQLTAAVNSWQGFTAKIILISAEKREGRGKNSEKRCFVDIYLPPRLMIDKKRINFHNQTKCMQDQAWAPSFYSSPLISYCNSQLSRLDWVEFFEQDQHDHCSGGVRPSCWWQWQRVPDTYQMITTDHHQSMLGKTEKVHSLACEVETMEKKEKYESVWSTSWHFEECIKGTIYYQSISDTPKNSIQCRSHSIDLFKVLQI